MNNHLYTRYKHYFSIFSSFLFFFVLNIGYLYFLYNYTIDKKNL